MPILEVRRDSGYADRGRAYKVVLDRSVIGEIRDGETRRYTIASGQHVLRISIDWCGSKPAEFSVGEGEVVAFEAKSGLRGIPIFGPLWRALFAWNTWVQLARAPNE